MSSNCGEKLWKVSYRFLIVTGVKMRALTAPFKESSLFMLSVKSIKQESLDESGDRMVLATYSNEYDIRK